MTLAQTLRTLLVAAAMTSAATGFAQNLQKVRIGYPPAWSAVEAAIPFGDTLGYFKEEGLALESNLLFPSPKKQTLSAEVLKN